MSLFTDYSALFIVTPVLEILIGMKYMTGLMLILQLTTVNRKLNILLKVALNLSDYHVNGPEMKKMDDCRCTGKQ